MKDERPLSFGEIIDHAESRKASFIDDPSPIVLLLDRLQDERNLGAIFRLADAARISKIYGYHTGFDLDSSKAIRVSRQTMEHITYEELETIDQIEALTKTYQPIALEYTNFSNPYHQYKQEKPCLLVLGSERFGVSEELLEICEASLHIPMLGQNSSMNVSVAAGIVVYHLLGCLGRV